MDDYLTKPIRVHELVAASTDAARRRPFARGSRWVGRRACRPRGTGQVRRGRGRRRGVRHRLIEQFGTDAPALLASGHAALAAGDADELRRAAHTLKSKAATFGALRLADRNRALEEAAKAGDVEACAPLVDPTRPRTRGRAGCSPSRMEGARVGLHHLTPADRPPNPGEPAPWIVTSVLRVTSLGDARKPTNDPVGHTSARRYAAHA